MTTRDQVRRAAGAERGETRATAPATLGARPPRTPARRSRAEGRRPVSRRAGHEDPRPLPRRPRARRLPRAARRRLHEGLPAQLRALPRASTPTRCCSSGGASAATPREPQAVIAVPRPIAAPRRGLTFSPSLDRLRAARRRSCSASERISASSCCGSRSRRRSRSSTRPSRCSTSTRPRPSYLLRGTPTPGATVSIATPGRDPYTRQRRRRRRSGPEGRLRRGENQFDVSAVDPETGKKSEASVSLIITVPFLVIEAPTLTVDQPADGATYENGAIPVQGRRRTPHRSSSAPSTRVRPGRRQGPAARAAHRAKAPHRSPSTSAEDGSFSTPLELTAGQVGDHGDRLEPEGKTDVADPRT